MQSNILENLNQQQTQAVIHEEGPLLIIAGAGTGKTSVITHRIAYLITEKKVKPEEILALTFTDKAALQMEERVDILVPYGFTDTWISTFHSFGDRVLRENALELGLNSDFQVLTRPETAVFFQEHLFEFPLKIYRPLSDPGKFIEAMVTLFNRAKDEDISPEEYGDFALKLKEKSEQNPNDEALKEEALSQEEIANCYKKYQELLTKYGKVDFGNQFYLCLCLFRKHPRILKRYQERFKFILVDEFQDTNFAQFQLLKLLAAGHKNISVVSDDDQCIFRFRGAAYSNILNFIKEYPEAKQISLIQNYRSDQSILDAAYKLIQNNNPDRFEVKANIDKHLIGPTNIGNKVEHISFDTISSEADFVSKKIEELFKSGKYQYQDFAILVRSNSDADPYLRSLNMRSIPWRFSGNQGLYFREEIRLCIAFLRIISKLTDSISLYYLASCEIYQFPVIDLTRCMNYSDRKNFTLFFVLEKLDKIPEIEISQKGKQVAERLVRDIQKYIEMSRTHTSGRLLYQFLTETGFVNKLVKTPSLENEEKLKNIAKFFDMVKNFETIAKEDRVLYFVNYLDMLINAGDDPATAEADLDIPAVNVLTIHKAKGLEFRVVFLVSLVMGRFPWPHRHEPLELPDEIIKDILPSGDFHIEEERRLFYVGMTRAKDMLYLNSSLDYGSKRPRRVSCFILEAMGLKPETQTVVKASAREAIERYAPPAKQPKVKVAKLDNEKLLNLSYYRVDDYLTCPLKYKYVHILRVPILEHHTVLYGKALHDAVQRYHQHKIQGLPITAAEVIAVFEDSFKMEGFLSREHQEQRLEVAKLALQRFFKSQEASGIIPKFVEKQFSFCIDNDRLVGRWDRIDIRDGQVVIVDFKSSEIKKQKDADKRAKDSLQLSIYSLAYQRIYSVMPKFQELHFLETDIIGRAEPNEKLFEETIEKIKQASKGIREVDFTAKPAYMACSYCAFNQICPFAVIRKR